MTQPGRIPDHLWPCPWCGHVAPEIHTRTAHLANCPMKPQETTCD